MFPATIYCISQGIDDVLFSNFMVPYLHQHEYSKLINKSVEWIQKAAVK